MNKTQVKVYFSLYGDDFPIDYVTESLGIEPTNAYKKGYSIERKHKPNVVSTKTQFRQETAWELGTDYKESYDVKEQIDQIIRPLKNKATIINQLKRKYKLGCDFSIVIIMENGDTPSLHLDNEQIEFAIVLKQNLILIYMLTLIMTIWINKNCNPYSANGQFSAKRILCTKPRIHIKRRVLEK